MQRHLHGNEPAASIKTQTHHKANQLRVRGGLQPALRPDCHSQGTCRLDGKLFNVRSVYLTGFISEQKGASFSYSKVSPSYNHPVKRFTYVTTEKKSRTAGVHDHMFRRLA